MEKHQEMKVMFDWGGEFFYNFLDYYKSLERRSTYFKGDKWNIRRMVTYLLVKCEWGVKVVIHIWGPHNPGESRNMLIRIMKLWSARLFALVWLLPQLYFFLHVSWPQFQNLDFIRSYHSLLLWLWFNYLNSWTHVYES